MDQICTLNQLGRKVYVGFMDLNKAYDKINRGALCLVLRMYDVKGKLKWYQEIIH